MSEPGSIPSDSEVAREPDAVRRDILAAMQRILLGQPRTVRPGSHSVLQLAVEAGVGRHQLYRRHPDLRVRFERLRDASERVTDEEERLKGRLDDAREEIRRLTVLQAKTSLEGKQWKQLVTTLQRAINVLQEELRVEQVKSARLEKKIQRLESQRPASTVVPIRPTAR